MYFTENFRVLVYGPEMNNILSKPIEQSEFSDIPRLLKYMVEVMKKADSGGLAAPQIGCFKKFILFEKKDRSVVGLVNPEITRLYGREIAEEEGCLSLPPPGNECMVPRLEYVDVETSLADSPHVRRAFTFRGPLARVVQHEIDHLSGTFFIDRISERKQKIVLDKFHNWEEKRRAQIRREKENGNVHTRFVTAISSPARVS
jgi:peptide deformylase